MSPEEPVPEDNIQNINSSDDYDSPWKEALEIYFKEFMEFFFPWIDKEIDWDRGYEFRDKEFQQIVRDAELGRRYADKLVSVWSSSGHEIKVMIHIEIQGNRDANFPERMYVYNYRIYDKHRKPVTSLAILADENITWNPDRFSYTQWECKIDFQFPTVKLKELEKDMDALLENHNPFAIITAAHLMSQASKQDDQLRYDKKWKLTRMLYEKNYSRDQILNLYRFVDWIMALPDALSKKFSDLHKKYEEEKKMPYITTAERIGREEGRLSQAREMVLDVLDTRFNTVPMDIHDKIKVLNNILLLKKLHKSAIQSKDMDGFKRAIQELIP